METGLRVLVVDDETSIRRYLRAALTAQGLTVYEAADGQETLNAVLAHRPDLIILDLGLPDIDGIEVTRRLREWSQTPIIILSVREAEQDKIAALDAGADDYLTKPFLMDEVVLRLRAMLRRTAGAASAVLRVGQLEYDVVHGRFNLQGQGLQLTAQEHKILAFFMHHPGKLLTRSEISENVYARDLDPDSNTLDVLIGRIRRKLGGAAQLVTERGQGFRLLASDEAAG